MENSLLVIFDEIPCTIVQGLWPNNEIHQNRAPILHPDMCVQYMYVYICIY